MKAGSRPGLSIGPCSGRGINVALAEHHNSWRKSERIQL